MTNSTSDERALELEPHADGSVFVVDPDPMLRDPVNGQFAVVAKCTSTAEAREVIRNIRRQSHDH